MFITVKVRSVVLLWMSSCINLCSTELGAAPKSIMDSFDLDAFQGRWFVEMYRDLPSPDFGSCFIFEIANVSKSGKKAKLGVSYNAKSNTTKEIRITVSMVPSEVALMVVMLGKERVFETVVFNTDYDNYVVSWMRVGPVGKKFETSVVSTRAPNTWKRFKEQINNDMKRAGLTETISDLIVAENDPSCK